MKRILIIAISGIVLSALSSCRAISNFLHDDEAVASVGQEKLYRSELNKLIPKDISPEDSAVLAKQYINSWASGQVFLKIAQEQLSKEEKDVSKELEEYRKSLLKYRYEQLFVNERLDTSVTDEMVEEYYEAHKDAFILKRPVMKARYVNISADSPMLRQIRKKMSSEDPQEVMEADSLAYNSARKFVTWGDRWIDAAILAREFSMDYTSMLALMKSGWIEHVDTLGVTSLAYISDIVKAGGYAPVEYSADAIRDIILSARKQNLIMTLERDLLDDARENGQFVVY